MAGGTDIFGYKRGRKPKGVFSTEESMLHFGGVTDPTGYLVQNWNVNYSQNVIEVFELGSNAIYWTKGRPIGAGTISRVIGFKDADTGDAGHFFPKSAYDICDGGALLEIKAMGGHCKNGVTGTSPGPDLGPADKQVVVSMDGCVVTSIGFTASVADTRLVENVGWRFAFMELKTQ